MASPHLILPTHLLFVRIEAQSLKLVKAQEQVGNSSSSQVMTDLL
jgi:hypothetical protein